MIEYRTGNIFDVDVEALVNTVNCQGFMGRGLSLQFKDVFPGNFKAYQKACREGKVEPPRMFVFDRRKITGPRYIVNFPTKRHWRGKSRMEDIESGLDELAKEIREREIQSIAIPPLGSGLGGLIWEDVREQIEGRMQHLDGVHVVVFEPSPAFKWDRMRDNRPVPKMTKGRAALVGLMRRYSEGGIDPLISLLEVHKMMYFMQCAGENLRLDYKRAPYGPYAEKLRHVLRDVEGYYVSGYADGGDDPTKQLKLVPKAYEEAKEFIEGHPKMQERFGKVSELVGGFESPFGLELLATVHWIVEHDGETTMKGLLNALRSWSRTKAKFTERQVRIAVERLVSKGWMCPLESAE